MERFVCEFMLVSLPALVEDLNQSKWSRRLHQGSSDSRWEDEVSPVSCSCGHLQYTHTYTQPGWQLFLRLLTKTKGCYWKLLMPLSCKHFVQPCIGLRAFLWTRGDRKRGITSEDHCCRGGANKNRKPLSFWLSPWFVCARNIKWTTLL